MKKPTEAIEEMRRICRHDSPDSSSHKVLAYLDSIPEWPADLTLERLEELADQTRSFAGPCNALRRLAEIAPKQEKRKVALWQKVTEDCYIPKPLDWVPDKPTGWRKVGEAEIDA